VVAPDDVAVAPLDEVMVNWSAGAMRLARDFVSVIVGARAAFVNVHTILAAAMTLAAGTVTVDPDSEPKLAGLPDTALLVSVHVALASVNEALTPSVS
jgi:hypothetical protein